MARIEEIRIFPPLAIARLGSSPEPMDNYELDIPDPLGYRRIRPAATIDLDRETGLIRGLGHPAAVSFLDAEDRIRPVAPFFEVWVRLQSGRALVPLQKSELEGSILKWNVRLANSKVFRRTGDSKDIITGEITDLQDHKQRRILGCAPNFLKNRSIHLGTVQYVQANDDFPQIRLRFTPPAGRVFGPEPNDALQTENLTEPVYNSSAGKWVGHRDATAKNSKDRVAIGRATLPPETYADDGSGKSLGLIDDICDGVIEVEVQTTEDSLKAYARIVTAPPAFAPDSMPIRTVHDELEQALLGPGFNLRSPKKHLEDVHDIVRRTIETVRLVNTGFWNQSGVGMALRDSGTFGRALEPIMDPAVADSLAVCARHERVLLALESRSLAWFARALREHDQVGDLSTEGRRKMPALLRGSDGRHLALTTRQRNKVVTMSKSVSLDSR